MPDSCGHCVGPFISGSCVLFQKSASRIGHQSSTGALGVPANFPIANNWDFSITDGLIRLGQYFSFPLINFVLEIRIYRNL
jgi:hypothetical protein